MADIVDTLRNSSGDNVFPIAGGMMANSITTNMLKNGSVTSDKIDWATVLYTKVDSSGRTAIVFGDGTLICTRKVDTTVNITTAWGSLYYGVTSDYYVFSPYSAPDFIEAPTVSYTVTTSANDALLQASWDASSPSNVNASNRWALPTRAIGFVRPNSRSNVAVTINIIAIGRWKA